MSRPLGATTITILSVLESQSGYGLDIIRQTGLLPGTVYTTLRRLERREQIEGRWEDAEIAASDRRPRRRYYRLTPKGQAALERGRERLGALGYERRPTRPAAGNAEA